MEQPPSKRPRPVEGGVDLQSTLDSQRAFMQATLASQQRGLTSLLGLGASAAAAAATPPPAQPGSGGAQSLARLQLPPRTLGGSLGALAAQPSPPLPPLPPLAAAGAAASRSAEHAEQQSSLAASAERWQRTISGLRAKYDDLLAKDFGGLGGGLGGLGSSSSSSSSSGGGRSSSAGAAARLPPLVGLRTVATAAAAARAAPLPPAATSRYTSAQVREALAAAAEWREEASRPPPPLAPVVVAEPPLPPLPPATPPPPPQQQLQPAAEAHAAAAAPAAPSPTAAAAAAAEAEGAGAGGGAAAAAAAAAAEADPVASAADVMMRPLAQPDLAALAVAMGPPAGDPAHVFNKVDTLRLTHDELKDLRGGTWLRDGIINIFFMVLRLAGEAALAAALAAGSADGVAAGATWAHNSFFYAKLVGQVGPPVYNYAGVKGWTAKRGKRLPTDLFAYRWVVMPVNRGNVHWTMAVIDNLERTVMFMDSLGGDGSDVTEALLRYVADEWADKKGGPLPAPYRVVLQPEDLPQQTNGVDCGAFVCAFGECYLRHITPTSAVFTQRDLPYWRKRVGVTCLKGRLLD
jgi:hypothetical protein